MIDPVERGGSLPETESQSVLSSWAMFLSNLFYAMGEHFSNLFGIVPNNIVELRQKFNERYQEIESFKASVWRGESAPRLDDRVHIKNVCNPKIGELKKFEARIDLAKGHFNDKETAGIVKDAAALIRESSCWTSENLELEIREEMLHELHDKMREVKEKAMETDIGIDPTQIDRWYGEEKKQSTLRELSDWKHEMMFRMDNILKAPARAA